MLCMCFQNVAHSQQGRTSGKQTRMLGRRAGLRQTPKPLRFSPFSAQGLLLGAADFWPPGCDIFVIPRWLPSCRETRQGGGWPPEVPPRKYKAKSPKLTTRRRWRGSKHGPRWPHALSYCGESWPRIHLSMWSSSSRSMGLWFQIK